MNRIATTLLAGLLAVSLAFPTLARAHDEASLDKLQAPNGGQLRAAGEHHFELVLVREVREAKENPVLVYVTDHAGVAIATAGATGSATLLGKGGAVRVALSPDGANRLKGVGRYASEPDLKAVVAVTLSGKPAGQARFTPSQAR